LASADQYEYPQVNSLSGGWLPMAVDGGRRTSCCPSVARATGPLTMLMVSIWRRRAVVVGGPLPQALALGGRVVAGVAGPVDRQRRRAGALPTTRGCPGATAVCGGPRLSTATARHGPAAAPRRRRCAHDADPALGALFEQPDRVAGRSGPRRQGVGAPGGPSWRGQPVAVA
jgi:hypothetical protein